MKYEQKIIEKLNKKYGEHKWTIENKVDIMLENPPAITVAQARKYLQYLKITYGDPQDFCGSFCNNEVLEDILMGKASIKETIIDNIRYYFSNGLENPNGGCSSKIKPDMSDKRVQRIVERYNIYVEE